MKCAGKWVDLGNTLYEVTQDQNDKHRMFSLRSGS